MQVESKISRVNFVKLLQVLLLDTQTRSRVARNFSRIFSAMCHLDKILRLILEVEAESIARQKLEKITKSRIQK